MKKCIAILCALASVAGALWFCMKFIARLSFRKKDHDLVHEWTATDQDKIGTQQEEELEITE